MPAHIIILSIFTRQSRGCGEAAEWMEKDDTETLFQFMINDAAAFYLSTPSLSNNQRIIEISWVANQTWALKSFTYRNEPPFPYRH